MSGAWYSKIKYERTLRAVISMMIISKYVNRNIYDIFMNDAYPGILMTVCKIDALEKYCHALLPFQTHF